MDAAFIKKMANKIDTKNLAPAKKATVPPSKRVEEVQEADDDVLIDFPLLLTTASNLLALGGGR